MRNLTYNLWRNTVDTVALQSLAKSHLLKDVSVFPLITLTFTKDADRKYSIKSLIVRNQELTHG